MLRRRVSVTTFPREELYEGFRKSVLLRGIDYGSCEHTISDSDLSFKK